MSRSTKPRNPREAQARERALAALARMRREKLSRQAAARAEHTDPRTMQRYVRSALRQDRPRGRYRATKGDNFRRDLQIPTALGMVSVKVRGSRQAAILGRYMNALGKNLRGDTEALKEFEGVKIAGHQLIIDPDTLAALASPGALDIDSLYAAVSEAGR